MSYNFTDSEKSQLADKGISIEEAQRQIDLLTRPAYHAPLLRPCTLGDGIISLEQSQHAHLLSLHREAAAEGRFSKFVPASGAASRMFRDLLSISERQPPLSYSNLLELGSSGDKAAAAVITFLQQIANFAFYQQLKQTLQAEDKDIQQLVKSDNYLDVIKALVSESGMGYTQLPKGLLKFHKYPGYERTPFEEHLIEATSTIQNNHGNCNLHFTVSAEHGQKFEQLLEEVLPRYSQTPGSSKFNVTFSAQKPSTDMLSLGSDGKPFNESKSGNLLLRPGGHGSLIENLADLNGDIIYIKNIDNAQPDHLKNPTLLFKKLLAGFLIETQQQIFTHLENLHSQQMNQHQLMEAHNFASSLLGIQISEADWTMLKNTENRRNYLIEKLNRPLRVCGVVKNTGEPGGGPFWLSGKDGFATLQIVEEVQVNLKDAAQAKILRSSTHFNPVDLVCAVRDFKGKNFDLRKYVDQSSTILSKKSHQGREITVAERPGLWNGAMAEWITIFVEVPLETFTPVKTVNDLLNAEHRS